MSPETSSLIHHYHSISPLRDKRLFSHFLIPGYQMTTISSVRSDIEEHVQLAKLNLGMLITLIDDLADHPEHFNPKLLEHLYKLLPGQIPSTTPHLSKEDRKTYQLAEKLVTNLDQHLRELPHYQGLIELLIFDLEEIYRANHYAEKMRQFPTLRNLKESQHYGPYNMGMLAAGLIDLMGSKTIDINELGQSRECFLLGQRMGRIGNLLSTYQRELNENDLTNEISLSQDETYSEKLESEFLNLKLELLAKDLKSFNVYNYAQGMEKLFNLHMGLVGII